MDVHSWHSRFLRRLLHSVKERVDRVLGFIDVIETSTNGEAAGRFVVSAPNWKAGDTFLRALGVSWRILAIDEGDERMAWTVEPLDYRPLGEDLSPRGR